MKPERPEKTHDRLSAECWLTRSFHNEWNTGFEQYWERSDWEFEPATSKVKGESSDHCATFSFALDYFVLNEHELRMTNQLAIQYLDFKI